MIECLPSVGQALGWILSIREGQGAKKLHTGASWVETGMDPQSNNYDMPKNNIFIRSE